jgi:hypothetical protein
MQWRVGEGIRRRPTLECALARLHACVVAWAVCVRGRGSECGMAARGVACGDGHNLT